MLVKINNFFDGGKYGHNRVSRMLRGILGIVLALEDFVRHQLTIFFLKISEYVSHGVIDGFCCAIADILEIRLLECGNDLLHKGLLDYCHLAKKTHFLGVHNSHV